MAVGEAVGAVGGVVGVGEGSGQQSRYAGGGTSSSLGRAPTPTILPPSMLPCSGPTRPGGRWVTQLQLLKSLWCQVSVILTIVLDTDTTRHDPSLQEYVRWVLGVGCLQQILFQEDGRHRNKSGPHPKHSE